MDREDDIFQSNSIKLNNITTYSGITRFIIWTYIVNTGTNYVRAQLIIDESQVIQRKLFSITNKNNVMKLIGYIEALKSEVNPTEIYTMSIVDLLSRFSKFHNDKDIDKMSKEDIVSFLDSFRKSEANDPQHKWIGTYNLFLQHLLRFYKWIYFPQIEPKKRPKPNVIQNIMQLRRKEKSIYKPADLWTCEDDLLFLKYCPSKRDKCYHTISRDSGCRPSELLKLRVKDVVFKMAGGRQYAEILVSGKTGERNIPLINSIPYIKDWLDDHPTHNPNSYFICGYGKSLGRSLNRGFLPIYIHNITKNISFQSC